MSVDNLDDGEDGYCQTNKSEVSTMLTGLTSPLVPFLILSSGISRQTGLANWGQISTMLTGPRQTRPREKRHAQTATQVFNPNVCNPKVFEAK